MLLLLFILPAHHAGEAPDSAATTTTIATPSLPLTRPPLITLPYAVLTPPFLYGLHLPFIGTDLSRSE